MKSKKMLFAAAALTLLTAIGHTIGHFTIPAPDDVNALATMKIMDQTLIPMPVGESKSLLSLQVGADLCLSIYLLTTAILLFVLGATPRAALADTAAGGARKSTTEGKLLLVIGLGLAGVSILSGIYFFPIPAIFTGVAALLTVAAAK